MVALKFSTSRPIGVITVCMRELECGGSRYLRKVATVPEGPRSTYKYGPWLSNSSIVWLKRIGRCVTFQKGFVAQSQSAELVASRHE